MSLRLYLSSVSPGSRCRRPRQALSMAPRDTPPATSTCWCSCWSRAWTWRCWCRLRAGRRARSRFPSWRDRSASGDLPCRVSEVRRCHPAENRPRAVTLQKTDRELSACRKHTASCQPAENRPSCQPVTLIVHTEWCQWQEWEPWGRGSWRGLKLNIPKCASRDTSSANS